MQKDLKILTSRVPQRNSPARPDFNKAYNQPHPYLCVCLVIQSCPTLCNPMDCSPPGSSVHGVLQERTLEWVAMPSSRVFSQPRDRTQISCTAGGFFTVWAPGKPPSICRDSNKSQCPSLKWALRQGLPDFQGKLLATNIVTKSSKQKGSLKETETYVKIWKL